MAALDPFCERRPVSGVGIGLRDPHFEQLMQHDHGVPWVELLTDNYLARGGVTPRQLERIAARFPVTLHCVGMNLGGTDPLDIKYLKTVRDISERVGAACISDHACFTAHAGRHYHELLPLPFDEQTLHHIARRIEQAQDVLGQRLVIENVSAYVRAAAPMTEAEFLGSLCEEADCDLLCDVNNLHVNQVNFGLDAQLALGALPLSRIREIHLAGSENRGPYLIDAHNHPVSEPVWALFRQLIRSTPDTPICIEWDNDIPDLEVLLEEVARAKRIVSQSKALAA